MANLNRFVFNKCSCNKLFRGLEFNRHEKSFSRLERIKHRRLIKVVCCSQCQVGSSSLDGERLAAFYDEHKTCSSVPITNSKFNRWLHETINYALETRDMIETPQNLLQRLFEEDEEDKLREKETERGEVTGITDISSLTSSDSEDEYLSSIKKQTNRWARDTEKARLSQQVNYNLLKDKLAERAKVIESLIRENEELKSKVILIKDLKEDNLRLGSEIKGFKEKEEGWKKECWDKEFKVKEIQSEWGEKQAQWMKKEKDWQRMESEYHKLKGEVTELRRDKDRQRVLEEMLNMQKEWLQQTTAIRTMEIHVPLYRNRVIDTPYIVRRWEVPECFEDLNREIRCEHIQIEVRGDLLRLQVQKPTQKRLPSE